MPGIFGYGSLINSDSRRRTTGSGEARPVRVRGWRRAWNVVSTATGVTYLGVVRVEHAVRNGVLFEVSPEQLIEFDARESGYTRRAIPSGDWIDAVPRSISDDAHVYVPDAPGTPTPSCPIVQSYVDVVLAGCLELGNEFAREFVASTDSWDLPWINDRDAPRYPRADASVPRAEIDSLLAACGHPRPG